MIALIPRLDDSVMLSVYPAYSVTATAHAKIKGKWRLILDFTDTAGYPEFTCHPAFFDLPSLIYASHQIAYRLRQYCNLNTRALAAFADLTNRPPSLDFEGTKCIDLQQIVVPERM